VLYGEGRKFVTGLVALRREAVELWAGERGLVTPYDELLRSDAVLAHVATAIDAVNAGLSAPERVRRFLLIDRELSAEHDEITPTLKIRRPVVAAHFGERLDALYLEEPV
jgi:long-chain acyl-CoA synthetase